MGEDHQSLRHWYDALSGSYDELYGQEQAAKHDAILKLLECPRFQTFVDVGCGTGRFLESVSQHFTQSVGIDVSGEMLRIAKSRIFKNEVEFVRAASPWLPLRDNVADCIVSISLIELGASTGTHIDEFERLRTTLGILAVTVFGLQLALERRWGQRVKRSRIGRRENLYVITKEDLD
ncbi:MAG TPA: class I SAM-dependent methyltransferase [Candidatus Bathyarchaeia archaeon]|nr:class I SAM-dependent methyltransferase [Candidatus Bathyarchaeia archaeon]